MARQTCEPIDLKLFRKSAPEQKRELFRERIRHQRHTLRVLVRAAIDWAETDDRPCVALYPDGSLDTPVAMRHRLAID